MDKKDIDRFFRELSNRIHEPLKVVLTGGVASWFMGGNRPTRDIDFGIVPATERIQKALNEVSRELGIAIQYSDDMQRWGMINIPDSERGVKLYKKFGSISVYLLAPDRWAIGKLTRYREADVEDLRNVLKKQKPPLQKTLNLWKQALAESPASSQQQLFKNQVNHFLKSYGKKIWGDKCPEKLFD